MVTFDKFDLKEELKLRNRKTFGMIPLYLKPDNNWVSIPIMMAIGKEEGPVILMDACTHGDEYEGAEAIIRVFDNLDPENMKGSFIGVPAVNLGAFSQMRRYCDYDFVPVDLNRSYPGNPTGTVTLSVGNYYLENIVKKVDAVVTTHGGGNYLCLEPVTLYQNYGDEISRKSKEMAKAMGYRALWQNNVCIPSNGIFDEISYTVGVPAVTAEIGGQSVRTVEKRRANIEKTIKGMLNVLRLWKVIDGEAEVFDGQYHIEMEYLYINNGGFCNPQIPVGEKALKGETLAIITNIFGEEVDRLTAPFDGIVMGYWAYSVCQPKSWVYMLGREIKE